MRKNNYMSMTIHFLLHIDFGFFLALSGNRTFFVLDLGSAPSCG